MKKIIACLIIGTLLLNSAFAQIADSLGISENKKWSISASMGWIIEGPSIQMEDAMAKYGFGDDESSYGFWEPTPYPKTNHATPSVIIDLKYKIKPVMAIGIDMGYTDLGDTEGRHEDITTHKGQNILVKYSIYNISPTISYIPTDAFIIGIGPSVYFTKAWQYGNSKTGTEVENRYTKFGFLIDLEVRIPKKSLLFAEFNVQYRYVGKAIIGPFNESGLPEIIPETEVSYSHCFVGAGLGFRFR